MSKSLTVDINLQVQKMYDEIGTHFSRTRQKTYGNNASSNWIVTDAYLSRLKAGQSVLDIGCGNGKLVSGLIKGVEYLGTDFSQTLLEEARRLHPYHEFRYGSVIDEEHWVDLPQFDAIFCVAVLHHLPYKEQHLFVLREIVKHLKKDGFAYISVWNLLQERFEQNHRDSAKLKETDPNWVEVPYNKKWMRFCYSFDIKSLTDIVRESGLYVQEIFYADQSGRKSDAKNGQNLICIVGADA